MKKNFTIGEALGWGFRTFFGNIGLFLGILGIYILTIIIASALGVVLPPIAYFITWVILVGFYIGYTKIRLELYDGKKPEFSTLFRYFWLLPEVIIAGLLFCLLVSVGLALFIIPGIYWASKYGFFYYVIVDKKAGISESFAQSAKLTDGIKLDLIGLYLLCMLISIIPIFAPAAGLALIYAYKKQQEAAEQSIS